MKALSRVETSILKYMGQEVNTRRQDLNSSKKTGKVFQVWEEG
jgi:hypothetical protein